MAASTSLPQLSMASMASMPSSAAQLMFFPFFNGSPLTSMSPINNGVHRNDCNGIEKYSSVSPNHNQMYPNMKTSSHSSLHLRESKASDSENPQNSVSITSEEENYGLNTPLNLSKPKLRLSNDPSPSVPVDVISRIGHESQMNTTQPPHESTQMSIFENSYWSPLSLPPHLKKHPFNAMGIHPSGLELMPSMDSISMYLANNTVPSMVVPNALNKDSTGFHSTSDISERKSDSVITCQSEHNLSLIIKIYIKYVF